MQTVITVFKDCEQAHRACERLQQAGFSGDDVHLQEASKAGHEASDRGVLASFGGVIGSILGLDDPQGHAASYDQAVKSGGAVLIVDAADEQQAAKASSLLREMGADTSAMRQVKRDSMERVRDMLSRQAFDA